MKEKIKEKLKEFWQKIATSVAIPDTTDLILYLVVFSIILELID